jgi:hypothetical protein
MSNTATKTKIQLAGIKVGRKVTNLSLLQKEILKPTNPEFKRRDFNSQINVSCTLGILADQLPHIVSDSKKFCSNPTAENLAHVEASLLLLSGRINNLIYS